MKTLRTLTALATAAAALTSVSVSAQVNGIATSNPEAVIASSAARQQAYQQIAQTYSAQIQQITALRTQARDLQVSLDTNSDGQLTQEEVQANPSIETQLGQIQQQIETNGRPAQIAQLYVIDQLLERYTEAQNQVIQQKNIQLMITPEALQYAPQGVNVTPDIVTALNGLLPTVSTTPPANYQPRRQSAEVHQAVQQLLVMAAQQQAAAAQQAAQPAPSGR